MARSAFRSCSNFSRTASLSGRTKVNRKSSRFFRMIQTSAAPSISQSKPPAILSLIGDTPLVEVTQFDTGPCQLFLKLENQNPTGSIKDRIALSMIEAAEAEGKLEPGGTVVEDTAGKPSMGLALVGGVKGYRVWMRM